MNISRIGIDLAKNVFQLHGVDRHGKAVWKRRLKRDQWLKVLLDQATSGCEIGMEACAGAHHWARRLLFPKRLCAKHQQLLLRVAQFAQNLPCMRPAFANTASLGSSLTEFGCR